MIGIAGISWHDVSLVYHKDSLSSSLCWILLPYCVQATAWEKRFKSIANRNYDVVIIQLSSLCISKSPTFSYLSQRASQSHTLPKSSIHSLLLPAKRRRVVWYIHFRAELPQAKTSFRPGDRYSNVLEHSTNDRLDYYRRWGKWCNDFERFLFISTKYPSFLFFSAACGYWRACGQKLQSANLKLT